MYIIILPRVGYRHGRHQKMLNLLPCLQYEERLNDAKREIKILYPEYLGKLKREFRYLIDHGY